MSEELARRTKEARGLLDQGKVREALGRLMHLTEKYPDARDVRAMIAEAMNRRGEAFGESGDLERAESDFRRSLAYHESAMAHVNLGRIHMSRRELDPAFRELTQGLEMDEDLPEAHEYLGYYFLETGDFEQAVHALGRAITKGAVRKPVYLGLWEAYMGLERKEQAHETAEELARQLPEDDEVIAQLGLSWAVCRGDYEEAEKAWSRAAARNPKNLPALFNLAGLAAVRGRREEAMDWLRKCVAVDRDRTLALWKDDIHASRQKFAAYAGDEDFLDILGAITQ